MNESFLISDSTPVVEKNEIDELNFLNSLDDINSFKSVVKEDKR